MKKAITSFKGIYAYLSNFHRSPFDLLGYTWPTNEHYYQAMKCPDDKFIEAILSDPNPASAKRKGRVVQMVSDWETYRILTMETGLFAKFDQNPSLKGALLQTGDALLEEGNVWHDNFWGNCKCPKCAGIPGDNMLGKLLMALRQLISEGSTPRDATCFFTGHRQINGEYPGPNHPLIDLLATLCIQMYDRLGVRVFISGMALGMDICAAEAVLKLKAMSYDVKLVAAVPFKGQEGKWPMEARFRYNNVLAQCDRVVYVSEGGYAPQKMILRDEYMVSRAGVCVALYDGRGSGGTAKTMSMAYNESAIRHMFIIKPHDGSVIKVK